MKHSKLIIAFGAITVLGVLNFTQSERGFAMSQALASQCSCGNSNCSCNSGGCNCSSNSGSSSSNGGSTGTYKWSEFHTCPTDKSILYSACEANGTGTTCDKPGEVTHKCPED